MTPQDKNHTPLPWIIRNFVDDRIFIESEKQRDAALGEIFIVELNHRDMNEQTANAKFIVRAANSHYALVNALEKLFNDIDIKNSLTLQDIEDLARILKAAKKI